MDKVFNFRDLGGIPTADGRRVKSGYFYRSAMLDEATDEDIEFLKSLGIKHVFDYRDLAEHNHAAISNNVYERMGAKHEVCPTSIDRGKIFKLQNGGIERAFIKVQPEDVCEFYTLLPLNNMGYKKMVQTLVKGDVPILQHCSAGKDRAGMGSALLLAILGVSYDEILKDYLKSLEVRDYVEDKIANGIPKFLRKSLVAHYAPCFIVDKTFIDAAHKTILDKYQTFDKYLQMEYGLSARAVEDLRDKYTE